MNNNRKVGITALFLWGRLRLRTMFLVASFFLGRETLWVKSSICQGKRRHTWGGAPLPRWSMGGHLRHIYLCLTGRHWFLFLSKEARMAAGHLLGGWVGVFVVSTQLALRLQCTITFISGWPVRKSGAVNEQSTSGLKPESPPRVALQWAACLRTLFPSPLGAPWPSSRQRWWNTPQCGTASHTSPTWGQLVMKKPHLTGPCKHSLSLNSKLIW